MDCNAIHPQPSIRPTAMLSRMAYPVMHAANKGTSVRWVATCSKGESGHSQAGQAHGQRDRVIAR
ncbi:MAG: hypothetical protein GY696_26435 [Gammaproteobacteria bacterium]|nr:hypothetical protein [Gammaproteobacteria bacterium]